jgi:pyruvate-formate lyase-activating enzyme
MQSTTTPHDDLEIDIERLVRDGILTRDEARALEHAQQADTGGAMRMEALPETAGVLVVDGVEDKDAVKEAAVKHKRHWVRVTRVCNQRCTFCLDSMNQDGTMIDTDSLKAYIALGRRLGRERLILSGGEASVHPDYLELIRYGKEVGYEWVQTVTNGMMFSYKNFARKAAESGLDEATVSLHGHTAYIQDKLTGTPGAFVTGVKGMKNLQDTGRVVVNVDVVINKQNYKHLPEIIEYYYNLGIREFDLLHIIPFGRGFDEHRHSLFFDLNDAVPYFRRAFVYAQKPGVYIWTNRLPVQYLEDFESLIQDPHKLFYEFDGGRHNFEGFLRRGVKPDCHGERCDYCFLDGPCRSTMFPYREALEGRSFPHVQIDTRNAFASPDAERVFREQRPKRLWLAAPDLSAVEEALPNLALAGAAVAIELDEGASLEGLERSPRVDRIVISSIEDAARILVGKRQLPEKVVVEIRLNKAIAAWLLARPSTLKAWAGRLVGRLDNHSFLSEARESDPTPETLRKLALANVRLKNVPRCIAGVETEPHDHERLDAELLDRGGDLDLDRYVHHYIDHEYYAKSLRCYRCAFVDSCNGSQVNFLRNFGFKTLRPLDAAGKELADAGSFEDIAEVLKEATAKRGRRDRDQIIGKHQPDASVRIALGSTSLGGRELS